jgi:anaerobic selenocysteine-containing dehydrogenase
MTYGRLAQTDGIQWPCTDDRPNGTVRLYEDLEFPTDWKTAEVFEPDVETGREHTMREYREKKDPKGRAVFVAAHYEPPVEQVDNEFPTIATSGRQVYHWHTRTKTGRAPDLHDAAPNAFVSMSREDAERDGIDDGQRVRVISRRGSVVVPAKVGDVMPPGVVFLPFHYGELSGESGVNQLMPNHWDPASKQPVQKLAAVRIEIDPDSEGE